VLFFNTFSYFLTVPSLPSDYTLAEILASSITKALVSNPTNAYAQGTVETNSICPDNSQPDENGNCKTSSFADFNLTSN
jgi:hypothetical protein